MQRSQLNTIEEALGYKSLKETYGLNAKEIGLLVGKSRPFIANLLRISNLSQKVQEALKEEKISESKTQARTYFDEKKLSELSESIKKSGVLQPIIVQLLGNKNYQLIAGERRLRASKAAGLKTIPCLVKDVTDKDAAGFRPG